jgi:predicted HicB family RNase H-like nuclease
VRKIIVLVALVAFVTGLVLVCGNMAMAAPKEKAKETVTAAPKAEAKNAEEPKDSKDKIVCKFTAKEDMQEFEKLYVAKQATFGRMSVLQAYFTMEQSNLQELDKQMEKKFNLKMDPNKMYDLNREAMEIKEVATTPQQSAKQ